MCYDVLILMAACTQKQKAGPMQPATAFMGQHLTQDCMLASGSLQTAIRGLAAKAAPAAAQAPKQAAEPQLVRILSKGHAPIINPARS